MFAFVESATNELAKLRGEAEEMEALKSSLALQLKFLEWLGKDAGKEDSMLESLQTVRNLLDKFA